MKTAFVTGATGCLGQALCADLAAHGWRIRSLSRHNTPPETPVQAHLALDLGRDPLPEDMLEGVDAVFHCAALSSAWGRTEEFHAANVTATERLLDAAKAAGVARFVFASTPSIYITGHPRLDVSESARLPARFLTDYARTKYQAEMAVRAANAPGFTTVALRPRAIYGRHDRALLPRLMTVMQRRAVPMPGMGHALIDPTHSSDAARAMRLAAEAPAERAGGRAYNITSGQAVRLTELLDHLERALRRPIRRKPVLYPLAMGAAILAETVQRLWNPDREPVLTRHAVAALGLSLTLDIRAAERDLGYVPRVTLEQGLRDLAPPVPAKAQGPQVATLRLGACFAPETALRRDRLPRPCRVPALAFAIRHAGQVILFDSGYGQAWRDATSGLPERAYRLATPVRLGEALPEALTREGIARIDKAVLSHLHADHVCGLFDLPEMPPLLTSAQALADLVQLARGSRMNALKAALPRSLARRLQALAESGGLTAISGSAPKLPPELAALGPGHDLCGDGAVISVPLPGHGVGQTGLWLPTSAQGPMLLATDAAYSLAALRDGVMPPEALLNRLGDAAAYRRTFAALRSLVAQGVQIIVSHERGEVPA